LTTYHFIIWYEKSIKFDFHFLKALILLDFKGLYSDYAVQSE